MSRQADELDEALAQYWRAARLRNNTTPPEEYHSIAKQAILALKQQWQLEARILELKDFAWSDNDGDLSYAEDRIAELEAQLTQSDKDQS